MAVDQDPEQFEDIWHPLPTALDLPVVEGPLENQGQGVDPLDEEDPYQEPIYDPGCQNFDDIQVPSEDRNLRYDDGIDGNIGEDEFESNVPGPDFHEDEPPRMPEQPCWTCDFVHWRVGQTSHMLISKNRDQHVTFRVLPTT